MNETNIKCPNCGHPIDVNDALSHQIEEVYKQKFNSELAIEQQKLRKQYEDFELQKQYFEDSKKDHNKIVEQLVANKLGQLMPEMEMEIKSKIQEEQNQRIELLEKENQEKSDQVKEFNKMKSELLKIKREKDELKESLEADSAVRYDQQLNEERSKIQRREQEKSELRIRELQKRLDDQVKLTEEMKRKQDLVSTQLHGEVQELAIEEWLRESFPFDTIIEVKKGQRGADCKHVVNTRHKENCGSIYYESKRTKEFGKGWIEKFKNDIREHGANIGIFVTDVLPPGMDRMGLREGVWICTYEEFKGLCFVIREHITALDMAISSQENKGEKMVMLYDYLTSSEFKLQVEGIMEGYTQMKSDLESEKRSIMGHWKKREKQLQKVLDNTNYMYNSLRGIAGAAIPTIKTLELNEAVTEEIEFENNN